MGDIKFSDGVSVRTSGPLRIIRRFDGYYVAGKGVLIPVESHQEGTGIIEYLKVGQYTTKNRKADQ